MADDRVGWTFKFLRNGNADPEVLDWVRGADTARQAISEAMNAKNFAFLLGAGCSSLVKGGAEVGIATMATLAKEFCSETLAARAAGFYAGPPGRSWKKQPTRSPRCRRKQKLRTPAPPLDPPRLLGD